MEFTELKRAFRIVWIIISSALILVLLSPFALPRETLLQSVPTCEWKAKYNRECILCGMSTAFILLSEGRVSEARETNDASLPLYSLMCLNEIVLVAFLAYRIAAHQRKRNKPYSSTSSQPTALSHAGSQPCLGNSRNHRHGHRLYPLPRSTKLD